MATPTRRALCHIGLATATVYATSSARQEAVNAISEQKDQKLYAKFMELGSPTQFHEKYSKFSVDRETEALRLSLVSQGAISALSIPVYAGLAHLLDKSWAQSSKFSFFPRIGVPVPVAARAASACGAFALSPLASIVIGLASLPVIQTFHNVAAASVSPPEAEEIAEPQKDSANIPFGQDKCQQTSVGTKYTQEFEAALPGYVTVVVPILEEAFFRGMVFARLLPLIGSVPAAGASAVLLASVHTSANETSYLPVQKTLIGLLTAWLHVRSGTLVVPMAYHCGNNAWAALLAAFDSTAEIVGERWQWEQKLGEGNAHCRELSPWGKIVAANFNETFDFFCYIARFVDHGTAMDDYPLLPLDFWDEEEELSENSIFYDKATRGMMKASAVPVSLRNSDGWDMERVNELIDRYLDIVFGDHNVISLEDVIEEGIHCLAVELRFHTLATNPEMAGRLHELLQRDEYKKAWNKKVNERIGVLRLSYGTGNFLERMPRNRLRMVWTLGFLVHT